MRVMSHEDDTSLNVLETEIEKLNRLNSIKSKIGQRLKRRLSTKLINFSPAPYMESATELNELEEYGS